MSKSSIRSHQVADLVQHALARALQIDVNDTRLNQVSITGVKMNADLSVAKVYYVIRDVNLRPAIKKALEHATGFLRRALSKNTELRYTPQLQFHYDDSLERATKINELMDRLSSEESENPDE